MNAKSIQMLSLSFALFTASISANAFAECDEVGSTAWNNLQVSMNQQFEQGNLDEALNYGKQLTVICDKNPIVNAVISDIYYKKNMPDESYKYIRRASDVVNEYNLPMPLLEKIWFRRAEFELPYKAKSEKLQKDLDDKTAECTAQAEAFEQVIQETASSNQNKLNNTLAESDTHFRESLLKYQWIGTGVAATGGALIVVGGTIMGVFYPKANKEYKKSKHGEKNHFQRSNQTVEAGIGLLAAGIGVGLAGSAFAIYSHVKLNKFDQSKEEVSFNVDLTPSYVGINMTF